mmetsp:Transcript_133346/g.414653  ORF Transcript_133346/g.414653 Transcript_133346/m.414653 type:complete len:160 (-) Transcript_133346:50-529(-)
MFLRSKLPRTAELLAALDAQGALAPESMSLLSQAPGTGLAPHSDCLNMVLCCHLALVVPDGERAPWIECGGQRRTWTEGEFLIFDQSFVHRTHNPTGQDRVVLAVDLWHYNLSRGERSALSALFQFVEEWNDSFKLGRPVAGLHLPYGWYTIEGEAASL